MLLRRRYLKEKPENEQKNLKVEEKQKTVKKQTTKAPAKKSR